MTDTASTTTIPRMTPPRRMVVGALIVSGFFLGGSMGYSLALQAVGDAGYPAVVATVLGAASTHNALTLTALTLMLLSITCLVSAVVVAARR